MLNTNYKQDIFYIILILYTQIHMLIISAIFNPYIFTDVTY